mgnify:CR=1 FL=1
MANLKQKYYEKRANVLVKNLHSRHFEACYCADKAEALKKALEWIPAGSSVGWGGAMSAQQIGLLDTVRTGDYRALDRERGATPEERKAIMKQCLGADVFIVVAGITLCLHVIFYRGDDGADDAAPKAARKQRTGAAHDAPKARRLHLPARRKPDAAPEASTKPAPNAAPAAAAPEAAPAKDDLFAAWDRAPVAAQPVTPAAPEAAAPAPKPAAPAQPRPAAPVQPKPAQPAPKPAAQQPAPEAADPLLAYLNSTPAAPETPKPDDNTDGSADGAAYSLDDILAEFSDF